MLTHARFKGVSVMDSDKFYGYMFICGLALSVIPIYFRSVLENGVLLFAFIVIYAVLYLLPLGRCLEKANQENSNGWWWACLLCWPVIPIYLFDKRRENSDQNTH